MSVETRTCPYCNSLVTAPPAGAAPRVICPRCGESFPARPVLVDDAIAAGPPPEAPRPAGPEAPRLLEPARAGVALSLAVLSALTIFISAVLLLSGIDVVSEIGLRFMVGVGGLGLVASAWLWYFRWPRTNGATAGFVLGNMAAVALIVLPFALSTQGFRRGNDPPPLKSADKDAPALPALGLLGYLPGDSSLVVAVRVADLLKSPAGKKFLEGEVWGPVESALAQVEKLTRLKREALDIVALGARTELLSFQLTVAVRTRERYDPKALGAGIDAVKKPMEHAGRLLYPMQFKVGQGCIWCVEDRTLLVKVWGLSPDFQEVKKSLPLKPRQETVGFAEPLRSRLDTGLARETGLAWVAGKSAPPQLFGAVLPFVAKARQTPAPLRQVTSFVIGLTARGDSTDLTGQFECKDETAALDLLDYLEGQLRPETKGLVTAGTLVSRPRRALTAATGIGLSGTAPLNAPAFVLLSLSLERLPNAPAEPRVLFAMPVTPETMRQTRRGKGLFVP
jgi:hypothetical protein